MVQTALDDRGTSQKTLLQASKGLVLNLNGGFLFKGLSVIETAFFEDGQEWIINLLLGGVILLIFLALLHLVTGLGIDRLLQNPDKDILWVLSATLLVDCLFALIPQYKLVKHVGLLTIGLGVALHLKLVILLLDLLLL